MLMAANMGSRQTSRAIETLITIATTMSEQMNMAMMDQHCHKLRRLGRLERFGFYWD